MSAPTISNVGPPGRGIARYLSSSVEAAALGGLALLATAVTLGALAVTTLSFVARIPLVAGTFGWCRRLADTVPVWMGVPAAACLVGLAAGAVVVTLRHRKLRPAKGAPGVVVIDTPRVFAYSLGGRDGQVVTSRGLLEQIDSTERQVVFAHEAAHLRLGHHHLLLLADVAALNPLMRPLRTRLRFALERAADEAAARELGDRLLVARVVSRVALLSFEGATPAQALSIQGSGVVERVEALLAPAAVAPPHAAVAAGTGVIALSAVLTWSQWPHLSQLVSHLCHI